MATKSSVDNNSDENSVAVRRLFKTVDGTTICKSIRNNDLKNLRMLLAKSPKYGNFRLTSGQTPLVLAFAYNKPEAVRLLLQHGARINKEVGHLNQTSGCYKLEFGPAILSVNSAEVLEVLLANVKERIKVSSRLWQRFYAFAIGKQSDTLLSLLTAKCQLDESLAYNEQLKLYYDLLSEAVISGFMAVRHHLLDMNMNQLQALLRIANAHNNDTLLLPLCKVLLQRGAVFDYSMLVKADVELLEILLQFGGSKIQVKSEDWCKLCRSSIWPNRNAKKLFLFLISTCNWVSQTKDADLGVQNLLFVAVERDWQEAVSRLLDLGADPNFTSSQKRQSPLYIAASKKLLLICKLLVSRGALLNCSDHEHDPMVQAVINGSVDAAETLLSLGSRCKCNERLVLALVKKDEYESPGRNVPCPQKITNGTLLHYAVTLGNLPIVEFMINRCHANIETTDSNGNTVLLLAANRLSPDIVEFLLQTCQERRLNTVSYMGQKTRNTRSTALYHAINAVEAIDSCFLECAELKIIKSFVKRNVDLENECNLTHIRALIVAIRCNQGGLIRDLIRCGLPRKILNESCIYESLLLQAAIEAESWNCVGTLMKLGTSIPGEQSLGGVPFPHYVIEKCVSKEDILQVFNSIDSRVDWNAVSKPRTSVNYMNGTVLHAAIRKNCDVDVIKYCVAKCIQSINLAIDSEEENEILNLAYRYINGRDKKLTVCAMLVAAGARLPSSALNKRFPKRNYAERKLAELLIIAGCDIHVRQKCLREAMASKHWFLSKMLLHTAGKSCVSSLSHLAASTQWPDSMQLESQMLAHPSSYISSLSALARQVIRQQLCYHTAGCSIIPASFHLPLPPRLQQYVLLDDISRCTVDPTFPHCCSFPDTCDNSIEQEYNANQKNYFNFAIFTFNTHVNDSDNDDIIWYNENHDDGNYWNEYRNRSSYYR